MEQPVGPYRLEEVQERYRVLQKLAAGGMADVFLGVQQGAEDFKRLVVIKRIGPKWTGEGDGLRMFIDEARLVASLNHPHIVKIFDLCWMGSEICIVMEYIAGESLFYLISGCRKRRLKIPVAIVCKLIAEAAEALQYAHAARGSDGQPLNLVHRDIAPQNLLLQTSGYLKVIDFGIAKSTAQTGSTSPGLLKGKIPYMAPDLFQQTTLDGRADLYALGLVLYEMLTLRPAFDFTPEVSLAEVMQRITDTELPTLSSLVPDLDPRIDSIFAKATHKDRDQRYQDGAEMATDIIRFAESSGGLATTSQVSKWFTETFSARLENRRAFECLAMEKAAKPALTNTALSQETPVTPETPSNEIDTSDNTPHLAARGSHRAAGTSVGMRAAVAVLLAAAGLGLGVWGYLVVFNLEGNSQSQEFSRGSASNIVINNVFVRSDPKGGDVYVNGTLMGTAGIDGLYFRIEPERNHDIMVRLKGYHDYVLSVHGDAYGLRRIVAKLVRKAEPAPRNSAKSPAVAGADAQDGARDPSAARKSALKPSPAGARGPGSNRGRPNKVGPARAKSPASSGGRRVAAAGVDTRRNGNQPHTGPEIPDSESVGPGMSQPPMPEGGATAKLSRGAGPRRRAPTQPAAEPVRQSMTEVLERRIEGSDPAYPRLAKRRGMQTVVEVEVRISRQGRVASYKFVAGNPLFHDAVKAALETWRFKPLMIAGRALETETVLVFGFQMH